MYIAGSYSSKQGEVFTAIT